MKKKILIVIAVLGLVLFASMGKKSVEADECETPHPDITLPYDCP